VRINKLKYSKDQGKTLRDKPKNKRKKERKTSKANAKKVSKEK